MQFQSEISGNCIVGCFGLQLRMIGRQEQIIQHGSGVKVVMLHSAMSSKMQWFYLMKSLGEKFHTIAVDLQGYGESRFPANTENYRLTDEIEHIETMLNGIITPEEKFHLIGHSYGGATALRWAHELKDRVLSLTLFEPVAFHLLPADDETVQEDRYVAREVASLVNGNKCPEAVKFFIDHWNGKGYYEILPKMIRDAFADSIKKLPLDFDALFNESKGINDYKESIRMPVCLMATRQSPRSPQRLVELLEKELNNTQLHWVTGGHLAPIFNANEVNPIIEKFL